MELRSAGFVASNSFVAHDHQAERAAEFHFFMLGSGIFRNGPTRTEYEPGTVFYTPVGVEHAAEGTRTGGFFFFRFAWQDTDATIEAAVTERFSESCRADIGFSLTAEMEAIRTRAADPNPLARRAADHGLAALTYAMLAARPTRTGRRDEQYVAEAKRLMLESVGADMRIEQLAERLGLDPSYFIRVFKRSCGKPPLAYFLDLKMDTAKHLLLDGSRTVRSIAAALGFHDELYFSRLFHRRTGRSPLAYRNGTRITE